MKVIAIIVGATFLLASLAFAGDTYVKQNSASIGSDQNSGIANLKSSFSLLDLSRFHMSQSYSLSYVSGSGQGRMIGMYLNQIDYEFAKPLHATVTIGWLHQPQTLFGANSQINNQILPSFQLFWDPSSKFHLSVGYETLSPYQLYNGRYSSRYYVR